MQNTIEEACSIATKVLNPLYSIKSYLYVHTYTGEDACVYSKSQSPAMILFIFHLKRLKL